jgi:hypothetical protein
VNRQGALFAGRTVVWFSCGVSSAVAAKLVCEEVPDALVINHDLFASEHPDNRRFFDDVQRWIGRAIQTTRHHKYADIDAVFEGERYLRGIHGAPCTRALKREAGKNVVDWHDRQVFGMTAEETTRIDAFEKHDPLLNVWWILRDKGITKADCFARVTAAGIELPAMYRLGYKNNNCIGCVKGGMGYWNKIRRDFPEVFARRSAQERSIGASVIKGVFLDELPPNGGRYESEQSISCGPMCGLELEPEEVKSATIRT